MKEKEHNANQSFFGIKIRLWAVLLACAICLGAGWGLASRKQTQRFGGRENYELAQKYLEVLKVIDDYYIGETDLAAISDAASAAMIKALGDQWSYYMNADEYEAYKLYSANQYAGIGVTIEEDTDGFRITGITAASPAERAGLQVNDVIQSIGGESIKGMTTAEVRSIIRSYLDKTVTLTIKNAAGVQDVKVDCSIVYSNPVTYELMSGNVGYVRIANFEAGSGDAAISAVDSLLTQGAKSIVFDVRANPGGLLTELIKVLDHLLPEGEIFVSVNEAGEETVTKSDNVCIEVPMAVLVNAGTYSAAEFFAAALSEFNWATVVGEPTTGKGRSQVTLELSDGSAVHISNNKYLTPNRVDLSEVGGLTPDVIAAMTEEGDAQLEAAIRAVS